MTVFETYLLNDVISFSELQSGNFPDLNHTEENQTGFSPDSDMSICERFTQVWINIETVSLHICNIFANLICYSEPIYEMQRLRDLLSK